jgi:hypothetical protein
MVVAKKDGKKSMSKKDFKKMKKRFEDFIEEEDNQLAVFSALVDVASETLPDVNVMNPNALLNVANNPREDEFNRRWAIVFLLIFILFFLLAP